MIMLFRLAIICIRVRAPEQKHRCVLLIRWVLLTLDNGMDYSNFDNNSKKKYTVEQGQRVAQLCPPELTCPIYVIIVDSIDELGLTTRGDGGFGSTGV